LKAQTACYQDVDDVIDLSNVPNTAEDIVMFEEKQQYVCTVQASFRKKFFSSTEVPMEAS
jgi:hypothetical protein